MNDRIITRPVAVLCDGRWRRSGLCSRRFTASVGGRSVWEVARVVGALLLVSAVGRCGKWLV